MCSVESVATPIVLCNDGGDEVGRACSTHARDEPLITSSVGKRSHVRPSCRWKSTIQLYLELCVRATTGFIWLMAGPSNGIENTISHCFTYTRKLLTTAATLSL
jgi:hypothetical protein